MTKEEAVILFFSIENENRVKEAREYILKKLEVLEILKAHFKINGFDELIPNGEWFDLPDEDRNKIFKEFGDDK